MGNLMKRIVRKLLRTVFWLLPAFCVLSFCSGGLWYLSGMLRGALLNIAFLGQLLFPVMFIVGCIVAAWKIFASDDVDNEGKSLGLILMAIYFLCLVVGIRNFKVPAKAFASGVEIAAMKKLNVGEVRSWLAQLRTGNQSSASLESNLWPQSVKSLSPPRVSYLRDNVQTINLNWGGSFWSWGIVIGDKGIAIPKDRRASPGSTYEAVRQVEDGIYIWVR